MASTVRAGATRFGLGIKIFCFTAVCTIVPAGALLTGILRCSQEHRHLQAYNKVDPAWNKNAVELSAAYKCVCIHFSYTLFA